MEFLDVGILKISDSELESSSRNSKNVGLRARTSDLLALKLGSCASLLPGFLCPLSKSKTQAPNIGAQRNHKGNYFGFYTFCLGSVIYFA